MLTSGDGKKAVLFFTSVANAERFVAKRGGAAPEECSLRAMDRERFLEWLGDALLCGAQCVIADPDPPGLAAGVDILQVLERLEADVHP
jgi:hypothetical protein